MDKLLLLSSFPFKSLTIQSLRNATNSQLCLLCAKLAHFRLVHPSPSAHELLTRLWVDQMATDRGSKRSANDAFAHRSTFPLESNNTHGAKRYLRDLPKSEYELIKPIAERHVYALHGHRVPLVARYQGFPTCCCTDINDLVDMT